VARSEGQGGKELSSRSIVRYKNVMEREKGEEFSAENNACSQRKTFKTKKSSSHGEEGEIPPLLKTPSQEDQPEE